MPISVTRLPRLLALAMVSIGLLAASGCASNHVNVIPMKVQSDPLGAYVLYQKRMSSSDNSGDWIYLGKTPINVRHSLELGSGELLRLRVMKDGYSDQIRDWSKNDVEKDVDNMGYLFWNPRLVPGNQ